VDSGVHECVLVQLDLPMRSHRHMHQFDCSTAFFVAGLGEKGGGFVLQNGPCPNGFTMTGAGGKNGPFGKKGGGAFILSNGAQCEQINPVPISPTVPEYPMVPAVFAAFLACQTVLAALLPPPLLHPSGQPASLPCPSTHIDQTVANQAAIPAAVCLAHGGQQMKSSTLSAVSCRVPRSCTSS
jgi:hypothetical protein